LGWIKLAPGQFKFALNQTKSASGKSKFGLDESEFASGQNIVVPRQTKFVSGQCKFVLVRYKLCFRECRVAMEGWVAWPGGSGLDSIRCKDCTGWCRQFGASLAIGGSTGYSDWSAPTHHRVG
jgi:hypothetical protein